jgi:hypothetical protein
MSTSRQTVFVFALRSIRPRDHFRRDCEVQHLEGKATWRVGCLVRRLARMLAPEGTRCFVRDLPEQEQKVVWAIHYAPSVDLLQQQPKADNIA